MKARFKYRIYPTPGQKHQLAKLFACVRVVWNDSLACCKKKVYFRRKKPINSELQKLFITQAKKTEYREWLSEVSAIPLQQSLNDLNRRGAIRSYASANAPTKLFQFDKRQEKR
ncbi:helix-turn-helix domain-containing protein [Okeania sp. KiyG1]|uniref:helix-turn-helix domain-containing protein n=1 Tax=Okeania sp. KiyG1 TaxID=2720165 RepID=UPI001922C1BA|nr:helix-turn-helix domain-containing protein [Okeania sp. KiyG1]